MYVCIDSKDEHCFTHVQIFREGGDELRGNDRVWWWVRLSLGQLAVTLSGPQPCKYNCEENPCWIPVITEKACIKLKL